MKSAFLLSHRPNHSGFIFEIRDGVRVVASGQLYRAKRKNIWSPKNVWTLWDGKVEPAYRGRGFQRRLIRARLNFARRHGAKRVTVWVKPSNPYSLNNLVQEGFQFRRVPIKVVDNERFVGLERKL